MKHVRQLFRANGMFLHLIWKERKTYYLFYALVIVMQSMLSLMWVIMPQLFLNNLLNNKDLVRAIVLIGGATLVQVVWVFLERHITICQNRTLFKVTQLMKAKIMSKACTDSLLAYEDHDYYENMNRAMTYTDNAGDSILRLAGNVASHVISLIGVAYIVGRINPLILLCYLALIFVSYFLHKRENKEWFDFQNTERLQKVRFFNTLSRLFFQKDFVAELKLSKNGVDFMKNYTQVEAMKFYDFQACQEKRRFRFGFPALALAYIQQFVSYAYFGCLLFRGVIDVAVYSTMFVAVTQFTESLSTILDYSVEFRNQAEEAQFFTDFMEDQTYALQGDTPLITFKCVEFRDVSFRYPGQERDALQHVSFVLHAGEKLAVVGKNGSGKTTLVKLLMGLYPPSSGQIFVDGRPLNSLCIEDWQKSIASVFQHSVHVPLSVEQDIALSEDIDTPRMRDSLEKVGMLERIDHLPEGCASLITREFSDKGVDFSGGEKQKLAIARAYYKESNFLVMDEPSSALDADTEYALFQQIRAIEANETVVFISHRMSSTRSADRILVLNDGEIEESGTHESLMQNDGLYAELFNKQAEYYCSPSN